MGLYLTGPREDLCVPVTKAVECWMPCREDIPVSKQGDDSRNL